ncbi:ubiquinol-cytochrome-c reductase complex assembly factor 1-like [Salvelinus namaycush]|uniref:Ubiquinol-cytochrome-c reductase complex assembly factor 1-like n=1 Tax=Salvelinus namaycush TaxID=8040 RepID=A0A8U0TNH6_SALNM|nr:ubiquinol-cytochrome-c reductase complex assembly factor 1-like [Salvelinus namaycush]
MTAGAGPSLEAQSLAFSQSLTTPEPWLPEPRVAVPQSGLIFLVFHPTGLRAPQGQAHITPEERVPRMKGPLVNTIDAIHRKESVRAMTETLYAAIFGYDEGILSDDGVLAAALWRNMFNRQCEDPRQLELMLDYVHKQMQFIDTLDGEDLLLTGEVKWRPLLEENAQSILKVPSSTYNDAGL